MPKYKGIYKRKNKKGGYTWYAYVDYNFKKYHVPGGYRSAEDARDARADLEKKLYSGTNIDSNKITFHDFSILYLEKHVSQFRVSTIRIRESNLRIHILPFLGDVRLKDLRPYHIEELQNRLLKTQSINNVRKIMNTLRNALKRAEIWEFFDRNPALKIEMPKIEKREKKILNPEQFIALLDNCENMKDKLIISLAAYAGLRRGEIFGLQWRDFDFHKNTLSLERQWSGRIISQPKSKKSQSTIPLLHDLILLLKEWRLQCKSLLWVFPSNRGNNPLDDNTWMKLHFKNLLIENDLPEVTLHSLRHSFASTAIASGISVADLQELMRHSTYHVTMDTYKHVLPNQLESALTKYRTYISSIRRNIRRNSNN